MPTKTNQLEQMLRVMIERHDTDWKAMQTWQIMTNDRMKQLDERMEQCADQWKVFLDMETGRGQRMENLVIALTKLVDRLPERIQ